jgi:hypothetical protein
LLPELSSLLVFLAPDFFAPPFFLSLDVEPFAAEPFAKEFLGAFFFISLVEMSVALRFFGGFCSNHHHRAVIAWR